MTLTPQQLGKPLKVIRRIQETPDAVSLVLEIPNDLQNSFRYQAGQFVSFFLDVKGQSITRSYSLSSTPNIDSEFKVTVKRVDGGLGSNYLCDEVKVGQTLLTTPPAGLFFKPSQRSLGIHYVLFAAGSGITPLFSILKSVLTANERNRVTLVFCNRNEDGIIYRDELTQWQQKYNSRFEIIHVLSQPQTGWRGPTGRLQPALIYELAERKSTLQREFYLCGPSDFMKNIRDGLILKGVDESLIHREDFGGSAHNPTVKVQATWTIIGPGKDNQVPEKIIAQINGETIEVKAKPDQSILETLLEAGAQPPYSCMDGACMACLGKVTEGRVYQQDPGILVDNNIQNCEALTCQAKPLSRIVRVSYDNL